MTILIKRIKGYILNVKSNIYVFKHYFGINLKKNTESL